MISIRESEYREGDTAIREIVVKIFSITFYRKVETTTNRTVVESLTSFEKNKVKVKGFRHYEAED